LVKAKTTGEYQVLETGSVLCLQDRTVVGVVAETLGRVQQPLYSIRFTNACAIEQAGISKNTCIYYAPHYSTYVFTQSLKVFKGSDASNIHDEEVGDDELEFSDDEAEAEYKRSLKLHKQVRRGARGSAGNGFPRVSRPNGVDYSPQNDGSIRKSEDVSISYDEISSVDDLYTPLARPLNLYVQMRQGTTVTSSQQESRNNGHRGGRSRGDFNKNRGGRGGRSRGRGGEQYRSREPNVSSDRQQPSSPRLDLSLPPIPPVIGPPYPMASPQPALPTPPPRFTGPPSSLKHPHQFHGYNIERSFGQQQGFPCNGQTQCEFPPQPPFLNYQPPYQPYSQHGQHPAQHYPFQAMNPYGQPLPSYATPQLPPGAFVNPVFFGRDYQQAANQQPFAPNHKGYPPQQNGYLNDQG